MGCWKVAKHVEYGFTCKYDVSFLSGAKIPELSYDIYQRIDKSISGTYYLQLCDIATVSHSLYQATDMLAIVM